MRLRESKWGFSGLSNSKKTEKLLSTHFKNQMYNQMQILLNKKARKEITLYQENSWRCKKISPSKSSSKSRSAKVGALGREYRFDWIRGRNWATLLIIMQPTGTTSSVRNKAYTFPQKQTACIQLIQTIMGLRDQCMFQGAHFPAWCSRQGWSHLLWDRNLLDLPAKCSYFSGKHRNNIPTSKLCFENILW